MKPDYIINQDRKILESKVFQLYETDRENSVANNNASNQSVHDESSKVKYSLNDIFACNHDELEQKVFCIPHKFYQRGRVEGERNQSGISLRDSDMDVPPESLKYVQIKK